MIAQFGSTVAVAAFAGGFTRGSLALLKVAPQMLLVIKLGSSSLVDAVGSIDGGRLQAIASDVAATRSAGNDVVIVSSGAIAAGLGLLGQEKRPAELPALQAASAVGQGALFARWAQALEGVDERAAQVLLTMHDAAHRASWVNARNTIAQLIAWQVVPIVNENDTTATDEITFGDNDTLAAQVAVSMGAQRLLLLTDTDGLYTEHPGNPGAERIEEVHDHSLLRRIDTAAPGSHWGSGGMRSKVIAAEMASLGGCETVIASSGEPGVVARGGAGERVGTLGHAREAAGRRNTSYRLWLRYAKPTRGSVRIDEGARTALRERGSSLLPVGIVEVDGDFHAGDAVDVQCEGDVVAKGITEYGASELRRLLASGSARGEREVVHRDQLVLIDEH